MKEPYVLNLGTKVHINWVIFFERFPRYFFKKGAYFSQF